MQYLCKISKWKAFLLPVLFCSMPTQVVSQSVSGQIFSATTQAPLPGVAVMLEHSLLGTASDLAGHFALRLPKLPATLIFHLIGYRNERVTITHSVDSTLTIMLVEKPIEFKGVVIEANALQEEKAWGPFKINQHAIKNVPPLGEPDVLTAIASLPGLSQTNDLKGAIHIRGGSADQTLFLIDGMKVYSPYHLVGLSGVFNSLAIGSATVWPTGGPARFGGKASGVIELESVQPGVAPVVAGHISLLSSGIALAHRWQKFSTVLSVRKTYLDLISRISEPIPYGYVDGNFKMQLDISPQWRLKYTGFANNDFFTFGVDENAGDAKSRSFLQSIYRGAYNWGNKVHAVHIRYLRRSLILTGTASDGRYTTRFPPFIHNDIEHQHYQLEANTTLTSNISIETGLFATNVSYNYNWALEDRDIADLFPMPVQFYSLAKKQRRHGTYITLKYLLGKWTIAPGLRNTYFRHHHNLAPRLAITKTGENNLYALSLYAGKYFQFSSIGAETKEWTIAEPAIPINTPLKCATIGAGVKLNSSINLTLKADVFLKKYADLPMQDQHFGTWRSVDAQAGGVELSIIKPRGKFTTQLNATFLKSQYQTSGEKIPFDWQVPVHVKWLAGFEVRKNWFLNFAFYRHSGTPYTPVAGKFFGLTEDPNRGVMHDRFVFGKTNSRRVPPYCRFDLSLRKQLKTSQFHYTIYLQVLNLFNRKNTGHYDWQTYFESFTSQIDSQGKTVRKGINTTLPVVPSIGIEFTSH